MARHRDVRNLDYEEEYDEAYDDAVYGHSVDDHEYGLSPSTEQYLYSQKGSANYGFGAYFPDTEKIKEEEEDFVDEPPDTGKYSRRDSSSFQRPRLSSEDEVRLNSVLDELRNVVGDQFSETELVKSVLEHHYDFESSLNAILNRKSSEATEKHESDTRLKREVFSIAPQPDGNFVLNSFDFLLPLSYSYSSAFCFESGNYERISTKQIIKEWQNSLSKCKPRNVASVEKKTHIEDENSLISNSSLDSTKCEGAEVNKERGITKVTENIDLADELTDVQISLSNLLPDNLGRTETVMTQFKNIHVTEDSDSFDSSRDTANLSVSPLSHDVSSSSSSFTFNIPSSSKNKEPVFNFGSPTLSTSPKLNFPSLEGKSKLASLAMNHLNGVGKSHPLGIGKSKGFSPLTNKISSSPVEKQSNLSALASAHLGKTSNKLGAIPSLVSVGGNKIPSLGSVGCNKIPPLGSVGCNKKTPIGIIACDKIPEFSLDLKKSKERLDGNTVNENIASLPKFKIPDSLQELNLNKANNSNLTPFDSLSSDIKDDDKDKISLCCEEEMNMDVDDQDHGTTIDLKLALLSKEEREKMNNCSDDKRAINKRHIKFSISSEWKLSKADRGHLAPQPFSLFGKMMIINKRKKQRMLNKKVVNIPYCPFDFSCMSPDDIIQRFRTKNDKKI